MLLINVDYSSKRFNMRAILVLFGFLLFLSCSKEDFSDFSPNLDEPYISNISNRDGLDSLQLLVKREIYNLNIMAFDLPDNYIPLSATILSQMTNSQLLTYMSESAGIDSTDFINSLSNVASYFFQMTESEFLEAALEGSSDAIIDYISFVGIAGGEILTTRATPCFDQYQADMYVASAALGSGFLGSLGAGLVNPFAGAAGFVMTGVTYFALVNQAETTYNNCLRDRYPDVYGG